MAFVARRRVGVGPEVKTESQREGRKSAMIAGFVDLGLVVCAMVLVGCLGVVVEGCLEGGFRGGGVWRCLEVGLVLVLFAGNLTNGYGVGCGRQAGRQAVFGMGRRMGFGAPLFDELDWKFQADKFYELSHN